MVVADLDDPAYADGEVDGFLHFPFDLGCAEGDARGSHGNYMLFAMVDDIP